MVVPRDLSVAGIDYIDMSGHLAPSLTTVRVPTSAIGTEAALKLIGKIEQRSPPSILDLPAGRVVRRSKARAPAQGYERHRQPGQPGRGRQCACRFRRRFVPISTAIAASRMCDRR